MFERFSEKAIKVIMLAQEECRRTGHNFVGTEQILLGLIAEGTGVAAQTLKSLGINLKDARIEVENIIGRGSESVGEEIPFTPRVKQVLELTVEEADRLGYEEIGTEHLLLGLVLKGEGVAVRVLENMGVDLSEVRPEVMGIRKNKGFFQRFSEKAIKAIMLAQEESRRMGHNFVGTEQILLGLIAEGTGIAAQTLKSLGVNLKDARIEVEKIIGRGSGFVVAEMPFTPRVKKILKLTVEEADCLGDKEIGTEHLLLGLIREGEEVAVRVLEKMGVDLSQLRSEIITIPEGGGFFQRFSEKAIKAIMLAQEESRRMGHNFVGTEQILLGLIAEGVGVAAQTLKSLGVNLKDARIEVENIIGRGSESVGAEIPFTPKVKKILELAVQEAKNLRNKEITTKHLLLGLVREGEGTGVRVLEKMGVDIEKLRADLLEVRPETIPEVCPETIAEVPSETIPEVPPETIPQPEGKTREGGLFPRFSDQAIMAMMLAQEESRVMKYGFVGTRQILLGLIGEETGVAAQVLKSLGIDLREARFAAEIIIGRVGFEIFKYMDVNLKDARIQIEKIIARGLASVDIEIPFSSDVERLLELAAEEADKLEDKEITTKHLLLGLLRKGEGWGVIVLEKIYGEEVAVRILEKMGINPEKFGLDLLQVPSEISHIQKEGGFFERFSDKAIRVMMLAQEESHVMGYNFVSTEQIFLGLIAEGTGVAAQTLQSLEVNLKDARIEVEKIIRTREKMLSAPKVKKVLELGKQQPDKLRDKEIATEHFFEVEKSIRRGAESVGSEMLFTPRAKKLLELAVEEADKLRDKEIATEHLLLSLVEEGKGVGIRVLEEKFEVHLRLVYSEVMNTRERAKFFEQFTEKAIKVIMLAEEESWFMGHHFIGGEHILLGLIAEDTGIAAWVLKCMGVTLKDARTEVEKIIGREFIWPYLKVTPFTPRAIEIFELALEEAKSSKDEKVDTEHFLLGLIRENTEAVEVRVLEKFGLQPLEVLQKIMSIEINENIRMIIPDKYVISANYSLKDYRDFLLEVLQTTEKSNASSQIVYPLLEANMDKLNHNFATVLRNWATDQFSDVGLDKAKALAIAGIIGDISDLFQNSALFGNEFYLEIPIAGYEVISKVYREKDSLENWAKTQNSLASLYRDRVIGDKAENIEYAIAIHKEVLNVYQKNGLRFYWAMTQNNLGLAYSKRIKEDRADNLYSAISAFHRALEVYTKTDFPVDWADTQCNLSNAYLQRTDNKRAKIKDIKKNFRKATEAYQLALSVYNDQNLPDKLKKTQKNLSNAYPGLIHNYYGSEEKDKFLFLELEGINKFDYYESVARKIPERYIEEYMKIESIIQQKKILHILGRSLNKPLKFLFRLVRFILRCSGWLIILIIPPLRERFWLWGNSSNFSYEIGENPWDKIFSSLRPYYNFEKSNVTAELRKQLPDSLQTQLKDLIYLLQTIADEKKHFYVYAYLQACQEQLDDDFIYVLKTWANAAFAQVKPKIAKFISEKIVSLCDYIMKSPIKNRANNIEIAIAGYNLAETILTRNSYQKQWAEIKHNLGDAYNYRIRGNKAENIELAIKACRQALQVRTKNKFPQEWATTQNNLGAAYSQGNKAENIEYAISLHQEVLLVCTKTKFPTEWAETQNNLGVAYSNRIKDNKAKNIELAIEAYEQALQIRTKTNLPDKWAETQNNLGSAYENRIKGDKAENTESAIKAYKEALEIMNEFDFPRDWAEIQNDLGNAYIERIKGDKAENIELAIDILQQALKVLTKTDFPHDWAEIQNSLGRAYMERIIEDKAENIESAIKAYKQSLEVRTKTDLPYEWADTQNNLGRAYIERIKGDKTENIESAIKVYEQSLEVRTKTDLPYEWVETQINLSSAYNERIKGDRAENIEFAINALQKTIQVNTPEANPLQSFRCYSKLGFLRFTQGNWQLAINACETAITAAELSRSWAVTDERRQEIMASAIEVYQYQVEAYINLGEFDKAMEILERSKARNLVDRLTRSNLYPKGNVSQKIITQLDSLRREIPSVEKELQVITDKLSGNGGQQLYGHRELLKNDEKRLQQKLQKSQQQLNEVLNKIKPIDPSFSLTERVESISYGDIQNLVDEDTAIIQWYLVKDKILTFIVTSNSNRPIVQKSSAENFNSLSNWADNYLDAYRWQKKQWKNNLASSLKDLGDMLDIDRLLTTIDNIFAKQGIKCNRLIFIPHRYLHLFPLHAMPLANGDLLIERFPGGVSYAPSSQLLQLTQKRERPHFSQLFAVQNPTEDLKYANLEVQTIRSDFDSVDVLIGKGAKKTTVKINSHLQSSHCIHFSCHGNFDLNIANASGLFMAQDDTGNFGKLTLAEIFGLNLNQCRLATLSACETGLIDLKSSSSDEYIGLPSAFLYAGAANVVSSLWTVDDISTGILMIRFYQNLKSGLSVALALNQAQLWLRDATTAELQKWVSELKLGKEDIQKIDEHLDDRYKSNEKPYQKPYYWAAFCAIGK